MGRGEFGDVHCDKALSDGTKSENQVKLHIITPEDKAVHQDNIDQVRKSGGVREKNVTSKKRANSSTREW